MLWKLWQGICALHVEMMVGVQGDWLISQRQAKSSQKKIGKGSNISKPKCWSLFFKMKLINFFWNSTKLFILISGNSSYRGNQKSLGSAGVCYKEQLLLLEKNPKGSLQFQLHNPDDKFWNELKKKKMSNRRFIKTWLGFACSCFAPSGAWHGIADVGAVFTLLHVLFLDSPSIQKPVPFLLLFFFFAH